MKNESMVLFKTGGIDSFRLEEGELPRPGPRQIRIRVRAAGVAFADVLMRHGRYPGAPKLPFTPGYDVTGTVDAVGDQVRDLTAGDIVAALTQFGGYARYVCVNARQAVRLPERSDPFESVCLPLNYVTAHQLLHQTAKVREGSSILVHSAAGGVGTALLQLGALHNLKMYATASAGKHQTVREPGGIPIDYRSEDFVARIRGEEEEGLDAAFDPIGGSNWFRSRSVLKKGGRLIGYGLLSIIDRDRPVAGLGSMISTLIRLKLFSGGRPFTFYGINFKKDPDGYHRDLEAMISLHARGKIRPLIHQVLPLEEVGEAHRILTDGEATGKIILDCS